MALCHTHHSERTAREQPAGTAAWRTRVPSPTVESVTAELDALEARAQTPGGAPPRP
jgi:hypothetical protein